MKNIQNLTKRGFTLIELLVVVLIIGIIAGIALPQYIHAVKISRIKSQFPLLRSIVEAQKRYYLATGSGTFDLDLLDVTVPYDHFDQVSATRRNYYTSWGYFVMNSNVAGASVSGSFNIRAIINSVEVLLTFPRGQLDESSGGDSIQGYCYADTEEEEATCAKLGRYISTSNGKKSYVIE